MEEEWRNSEETESNHEEDLIEYNPLSKSSLAGSSVDCWNRRYDRYLAFRKSNLYIPPPILAPKVQRKHYLCLVTFESIGNIKVTDILQCKEASSSSKALLPSSMINNEHSKDYIGISIQMTYFYKKTKQFFGNTWSKRLFGYNPRTNEVISHENPSVEANISDDIIDAKLNESVGFITSIIDSECVTVIELVMEIIDGDTNVAYLRYALGWSIGPVFDSKPEETVEKCIYFYEGSPRVLWEITDMTMVLPYKKMPLHLNFCFKYEETKSKLYRYIREYETFGSYDIIPGIEGNSLHQMMFIKALKENTANPKKPTQKNLELDFDILTDGLMLAPTIDLFIKFHSIAVPFGSEIEKDLVLRLRENQLRSVAGLLTVEGNIISRVVEIHLHNGRKSIGKTPLVIRLRQEKVDDKSRLILLPADGQQEEIELKKFVLNPYYAIVVSLVFTVQLRYAWEEALKKKKSKEKLAKTASFVPLKSDETFSVTMGAKVLLPCTDDKLYLYQKSIDRSKKKKERKMKTELYTGISIREVVNKGLLYLYDISDQKIEKQAKQKDYHMGLTEQPIGQIEMEFYTEKEKKEETKPKEETNQVEKTIEEPEDNAWNSEEKKDENDNVEDDIDSMGLLMPIKRDDFSRAFSALLCKYGFIDTNVSTTESIPNQRFKEDIEMEDTLERNEIQIQFAGYRAYASDDGATLSTKRKPYLPQSIYVTFSFYNFLPYTSCSMELVDIERENTADGVDGFTRAFLLAKPGLSQKSFQPIDSVRFSIDHSLPDDPHTKERYCKYFLTKTLYIDIWDGDSRLPIGTACVPLNFLLRQGKRAQQITGEYYIFQDTSSLLQPQIASANMYKLKGKIQLVLTNYGMVGQRQRRNFQQPVGNLMTGPIYIDPLSNNVHTYVDKVSGGEHLRDIKKTRDIQKQQFIQSLLEQQRTTTYEIFTTFGESSYFEYSFCNRLDHSERYHVLYDKSDGRGGNLCLITNYDEWEYFRQHVTPAIRNTTILPIEKDMVRSIHTTDNRNRSPDKDNIEEIFLRQNETIPLAFRYITYNEEGEQSEPAEILLVVRFKSATTGKIVGVLYLKIHAQPYIVNRTYHLMSPLDGICRYSFFYRCQRSDDCKFVSMEKSVAIEANLAAKSRNVKVYEIALKYNLKARGSLESRHFYVLLYKDLYFAQLDERWRIQILPSVRMDITAIMGETCRNELIIKGTRSLCAAKCFSSIPEDLRFNPSETFDLFPAAYNRVEMETNFMDIGRKEFYVHLLDAKNRDVVGRWIVNAIVSPPVVSKTYDLFLVCNHTARKRIAYRNPWTELRGYYLRSSEPMFMRPVSSPIEIKPLETSYIRLVFNNIKSPMKKHIYLFIYNQFGQNEDTILLHVVWKAS